MEIIKQFDDITQNAGVDVSTQLNFACALVELSIM